MTYNAADAKVRTHTEWVCEPTDEHGDITDPAFYRTEREARADAPRLAAHEAAYVDVARVTRIGSNNEGEMDRRYHYVARYLPDGSVLALRNGEYDEPVVVGI